MVCTRTDSADDGHHCQKPVVAGGVCTDIRECEGDAICVADPEQGEVEERVRHCVRFIRRGEGETCTQGPGRFDGPAWAICWSLTAPLLCDETGQCARPSLAKEGESCERLDCAAGLVC